MIIQTADDQLIAMSAFDYCLGRTTYMAQVGASWIQKHWDQLDARSQAYITKQIGRAIQNGWAGHDCDTKDWQGLLDWIESQS